MFSCLIDEEEFPVWAYGAIGGFVLLLVLVALLIAFCRSRKQNKPGIIRRCSLLVDLVAVSHLARYASGTSQKPVKSEIAQGLGPKNQ